MSTTNKITVDRKAVQECIDDLKKLYEEVNVLDITNQNLTGAGKSTDELKNIISILTKNYKVRVMEIIEQSQNWADKALQSAEVADNSSSVNR